MSEPQFVYDVCWWLTAAFDHPNHYHQRVGFCAASLSSSEDKLNIPLPVYYFLLSCVYVKLSSWKIGYMLARLWCGEDKSKNILAYRIRWNQELRKKSHSELHHVLQSIQPSSLRPWLMRTACLWCPLIVMSVGLFQQQATTWLIFQNLIKVETSHWQHQ